jgi:hypothetical protein
MERWMVGRQAEASRVSTESSWLRKMRSLPELAWVAAMNSLTGLARRRRGKVDLFGNDVAQRVEVERVELLRRQIFRPLQHQLHGGCHAGRGVA